MNSTATEWLQGFEHKLTKHTYHGRDTVNRLCFRGDGLQGEGHSNVHGRRHTDRRFAVVDHRVTYNFNSTAYFKVFQPSYQTLKFFLFVDLRCFLKILLSTIACLKKCNCVIIVMFMHARLLCALINLI